MMNYQKPATENVYKKAERVSKSYEKILSGNEAALQQVYYYFEKERSWAKQIVDILYRDLWHQLLPGTKHMLFIQTQSFLKQVYDNIEVPDGLCLDVYGRVSRITKDWTPESNEIPHSEYDNYKSTLPL